MKLLFDCTELSYFLEKNGYRAGVFYVAFNLFREFKKCGIDMSFVCNFKRYYFMKQVMREVEEFQEIDLLPENSYLNRFIGLLSFGLKDAPLKIQYAILSLARYYENIFYVSNKKNQEQLKDFKIFFSPFTPASKEIMTAKNLKRFMMLHDIIPILEEGKIPSNRRLWCYRLYNTIHKNDFYVTNSENTKQDILKYYSLNPENIKTTLLGVNENFKPSKKNSDKKYVFSLCTLGKRKNLIFALKNYFEFIKKNNIDDLYFVLGGSIWKKFEKELNKSLGEFDKSKIIFTGYVKDEDLPALYSNAFMFVYPSLYEGFGLPVLESMKCGCPVITSNISSLPEVIGDCGIQINPKCDEEMLKAYEKMYFDTKFREGCIQKGLERANNFSWEKCTLEILEFMKEKLNQLNK